MLQFVRDGAAGIKPTHLAIIFDKSENSFRTRALSALQGHRPDPPEDLVPQFPLMRATVRAFGLTPIEQDRYEADDLIATYARQARERGADVLIVSADKDLMQLIGPGVAMFDPASGDREERRIGPDEVFAYFGVDADKVVDIQALAGDSTDNVPGAPGIGVKTAAQLIAEYGDLETLLARAGEIKQPKRRETLTNPDTVALIRLSKQLVTLVRDVDVEVAARRSGARRARRQTLIAFLKAMEFTTITRRVAELYGIDADAIEPDPRFVGAGGWRGRNGERGRSRATPSPAARKPRRPSRRATRSDPAGLAAERAAERAPRRSTAPPTRRSRRRDDLQPWIERAFETGARRLRHRDDLARSDAGRDRRRFARRRAGRSLLRPDRPSPGGETTCSTAAGSRRARSPRPRRSRC